MIELCIQRPILTLMLTLSLVVFGVLGYRQLGVDQMPNMEFPVVTITAQLEGAAPEVFQTPEQRALAREIAAKSLVLLKNEGDLLPLPADLARLAVIGPSADDVRRIVAEGRIACLLGVEGGHIIEDSLAALRTFFRLGVRYMTLTHSFHTAWADSSGTNRVPEPLHRGLTPFGEQVVREMNRLGMMVDVSHVSDETFESVLRVTRAPVIASHSSVRALADHPRNLSDPMLRALAATIARYEARFGEIPVNEPKPDAASPADKDPAAAGSAQQPQPSARRRAG